MPHNSLRTGYQVLIGSQVAVTAKITVCKFNEDKTGAVPDLEIMLVFRGNDEQIAGFIRKPAIIKQVYPIPFKDIYYLIIGMAMSGQMKLLFFKIVNNQWFKLLSLHTVKIQVYAGFLSRKSEGVTVHISLFLVKRLTKGRKKNQHSLIRERKKIDLDS